MASTALVLHGLHCTHALRSKRSLLFCEVFQPREGSVSSCILSVNF